MKVFSGTVQRGAGRAAALGFPTVNIPLEDSDISGIYAARVKARGGTYHSAAFADPEREMLEAHILDGEFDLYGEEIAVEILEKIRDSEKFQNDESLRIAIANDIERVRSYFLQAI